MFTDEITAEAALHEVRDRIRMFELDRREFLRLCSGGLLVVAGSGAAGALAQESGRSSGGHQLPQEASAWIHISADTDVTVFTGKVEIGQNIRTSLAQSVAEELRAPFSLITMVMGDTDLVPWDAGTFGSQSTPRMGPQLRTMARTAREMLVEAAAERWKTDATTLIADEGRVTNPATSESLRYGEITRGQKLTRTITGDPPLTPATKWKIAGTPAPKVNGQQFVTGKHTYPSDVVRPGMLFGKVVRPAGYNATLASADTSMAEKIPGVRVVRDGDFIGVVADDVWAAEQAVLKVDAKWKVPAQISNAELFAALKKGAGDSGQSEIAAALAGADVKLEQTYTVAYIAHAPLEPRAAVAEWADGKLTVWTGTQRPFGVKEDLAKAFRLPAAQVRVIMPDMGSGYGGKHTGECAVEAARLAKAAGKPVKLIWTREEEFTWAYFRPAGVIEIRSGVQHDGTLVAWEHHNYNSGPSGAGTPYKVANPVTQYHEWADAPLAQGSYRGLAATANHFARETHMDELAHRVAMDPLEFRLKNLEDLRLRAVFTAAAESFGWEKEKSTATRGFGIAGGTEKGGYTAACAEVEIDTDKKVRVRRLVQAWESGAVVNPDGLRNQIMGAMVQALGGALFESIQFAGGKVTNAHFAEYRVPRLQDTPQIEVVLIDRKDLPSAGAGETGIVAVAPAVGNAIFAATGVRLRDLPMEQGIEIASGK
ncbi:MAG TPA: molybdopterin cofactor-binding domain-containing protein [Acidobacteriaceae bacterium]|jgi:isoquinoline 1-oxidoreductase|nr:molybdopterin cofactor-binding domain-containing protein [Acidobacteriaceae bacterium]